MKKFLISILLLLALAASSEATIELKTNTATIIAVGPLVDPTDGKTAETGLTVTDLSIQIYQIKNDGNTVVRAQFAPTASGGNNDMALVTSSTDGMYALELTAAQLNWLGNGKITAYDVDGFLVWAQDFQVVSAGYFEYKYGSTAPTVLISSGTGTGQLNITSGVVDANATKMSGTSLTARDIGASVLLSSGTGTGQLNFTSGVVQSDVAKINNVATTSVTTINANVGTTQPMNYTGTGASALVKSDMVDIAGSAVSTSTAQIGANAVQIGGAVPGSATIGTVTTATNVTTVNGLATGAITAASIAADAIGASELAADAATEIAAATWNTALPGAYGAGTGGYILGNTASAADVASAILVTPANKIASGASGVVTSNLSQINGTSIAGTGTRVADSFLAAHNVATPVWTMASVNQTGDAYAIVNNGTYGNAQLVRSTTPANTLDVAATGEAGLDFNNVKQASGATTLLNITVPVVSSVSNGVTVSVGTGTGQINVASGKVPATLAAADVSGNVPADVKAITTGVDFSATQKTSIAQSTWNAVATDYNTALSMGNKLNSAASAGDPWSTAIPGAYGAGTAGYILGNGVKIQPGTGTGQLSVTSGIIGASMNQINGTSITGTGTRVADSFLAMHNIASPTFTTASVNQTGDNYARLGAPAGASVSADIAAAKVDTAAIKVKTDYLPSATAGSAGGVFIAGSNAATSVTTALTANITGNVTGNLTGSVGSVTGAVGSVTGAVGSVTGAVGSVGAGGINAAAINADLKTGNYINAQVKGQDNIDFGALQKGSLNAATPTAITGLTLRKNQAVTGFTFKMILSSDHRTAATGKTITATRSIDGGAFAACTNTATEISSGFYAITLSASDLNGNIVTLRFTASGCDPTEKTFILSQ